MATETVNLEKVKADYEKSVKNVTRRIVICAGTGCLANGSLKVFNAFAEQLAAAGANVIVELSKCGDGKDAVHVSKSGCQGFCQMGPLVTVKPDGLMYVKVKADDVAEIIEKTILKGEAVDRLLYRVPGTETACRGEDDIPFYTRQKRFVLQACGEYDPEDINEYIAKGGYEAARCAYVELQPQDVCSQIIGSGLRGRGGGGFPTGKKWEITLKQPGVKKYVICNGDEGDPVRSWTAASWKAIRTASSKA